MKEECKHEFKISVYDILSLKGINDREFKCIHCKKRIQMKFSRIWTSIITFPLVVFIVILFNYIAEEYLASAGMFIKCVYFITVLIGFVSILVWATNGVVWLFRKRIKYVEIEDDDIV
jgi:hypothetical protein